MAEKLHFVVEASQMAGQKARRLDSLLKELTSESRSFIKTQIDAGRVKLNGAVVRKPNNSARVGDTIEAEWLVAPVDPQLTPVDGNLQVLFEDKDLLVLDKPQGLVVHPAPSHQGDTLVNYLLHHLERDEEFSETSEDRPGIVHRLDKGTSGILLIAKNRHAQENLSAQFKDRKIKKTYEALVWGKMEGRGQFRSSIGRDRANRRKMSSRTTKGRDALTEWQAHRTFPHFTHVRLFPHTGRTHQLRVHLTEANHPIVGDPLYGRGVTESRRKELPAAIVQKLESLDATLLHAAELQLLHPATGEPRTFQAARPAIFNEVLALLEEGDK